MDIRQLRYFIAIVEERTVSAAAKRLHLSQPPLSQQLKGMEEELGVPLVERSGKGLEVTEAGSRLYAYALQMVQLMEEAEAEVKEVGEGVNGKLTIGVNTFSVAGLPELLHRYRELYPKATYKIRQNESAQLVRLVKEREIEMAFVRLPLKLDSEITVLHHDTEPFYLITSRQRMPLGHDAALADIQPLPLLLPSTQGLGVHDLIQEAFARASLLPNLTGECSDIALLMRLVASDFCASIVPATLLTLYEADAVHARRLSDAVGLSSPIGLIALKDHRLSKTAENFIELFKRERPNL